MSKTIIITGASDGIGAAAARRLGRNGHEVVVVGRSPGKTEAVAKEIDARFFVADFTKLEDVRRLVAALLDACQRIDVLANNAGGMFGDRAKTEDGFEKTFQINHLAPFLLTSLLLPRLLESRASVIQTSSIGSRLGGRLDMDDLQHDRDFSPILAYSTTKLENILFTRELHRRFNSKGLSAAAFHPGNVATRFGTQSESRLIRFITTNPITRAMLTTPEKGARQLVWLAEGQPGTDWISGSYYEKGQPARRENKQGQDAALARTLWERSEQLLGIAKDAPASGAS